MPFATVDEAHRDSKGNIITCECDLYTTPIQTQKEGKNKGRWFIACPKQKNDGQCKFFAFLDDEGNPIAGWADKRKESGKGQAKGQYGPAKSKPWDKKRSASTQRELPPPPPKWQKYADQDSEHDEPEQAQAPPPTELEFQQAVMEQLSFQEKAIAELGLEFRWYLDRIVGEQRTIHDNVCRVIDILNFNAINNRNGVANGEFV